MKSITGLVIRFSTSWYVYTPGGIVSFYPTRFLRFPELNNIASHVRRKIGKTRSPTLYTHMDTLERKKRKKNVKLFMPFALSNDNIFITFDVMR